MYLGTVKLRSQKTNLFRDRTGNHFSLASAYQCGCLIIPSQESKSHRCKVSEYRRQTGEGQEQGREVFLNIHVAQESFYDTKIASMFTKLVGMRSEASYNSRVLRLHGWNQVLLKLGTLRLAIVNALSYISFHSLRH